MHEDIDGLFGVVRRYLSTRSWKTYAELVQHIKDCFSALNERTPVIVHFLHGTLSFDNWLTPVIDKKLSNFSRQHNNFNPGMHALRFPFRILRSASANTFSTLTGSPVKAGQPNTSSRCFSQKSFRMSSSRLTNSNIGRVTMSNLRPHLSLL